MTTFFWADNFEEVYYWINKKLLKTESAKLRGLRGLVGHVGHVDTWVRRCVDDVGRKFAWFTWFAWVYKILAWVWHFACVWNFAWVWNFDVCLKSLHGSEILRVQTHMHEHEFFLLFFIDQNGSLRWYSISGWLLLCCCFMYGSSSLLFQKDNLVWFLLTETWSSRE